jgi:hypothetical protein
MDPQRGIRREHEAIAANAIRWRRIQNGEPTAAYVLERWRAGLAKQRGKGLKLVTSGRTGSRNASAT